MQRTDQSTGPKLKQAQRSNQAEEQVVKTPGPQKKKNNEQKDKKKTEPEERKSVSFFQLFRYSQPSDKFLIVVATILAAIHGVMVPSFSVVFGRVTDDFTPDKSPQERRDQAVRTALIAFIFALITFISAGAGITLWR